MQRQHFDQCHINTLSARNDHFIDWSDSGRQFFFNGRIDEAGSYSFGSFDGAVTSESGIYSVIYKKLGTKGLLLKNGAIMREINRSYYMAELYEYPAVFAKLANGRDILIHCPRDYCRIDFEDVETGEILTDHADRKPSDFFHSRLDVSDDNQTLLSKGWAWHPFDFVEVFDIDECIKNPLLLDKSKFNPPVDAPLCNAGFITNELVLIGSGNDDEPFDHGPSHKLKNGQIAIWNIKTNEITNVITPDFMIGGNIFPLDDNFAWDLFDYPKIVNFRTGEVVDELKEIRSGKQISSIIGYQDNFPVIAFNKRTKQVAIYRDQMLDILVK